MTAKRWKFFCYRRTACMKWDGLWQWAPAPPVEDAPKCPFCGTRCRIMVEGLPKLRASRAQQEVMVSAGTEDVQAELVGRYAYVGGAFVVDSEKVFSTEATKLCLEKGFIRQNGNRLVLTRKGWNTLPERLQADVPVPSQFPCDNSAGKDYY